MPVCVLYIFCHILFINKVNKECGHGIRCVCESPCPQAPEQLPQCARLINRRLQTRLSLHAARQYVAHHHGVPPCGVCGHGQEGADAAGAGRQLNVEVRRGQLALVDDAEAGGEGAVARMCRDISQGLPTDRADTSPTPQTHTHTRSRNAPKGCAAVLQLLVHRRDALRLKHATGEGGTYT